jgi:ARG and Rhodanese-Phosphatase-superfamily-associated Protein domain
VRVLEEPADEAPIPFATGRLPELSRAVTRLRIGGASRHGGLQVFWLHATETAPPLSIATLDEARSSGALGISERDRASVPELVVDNRGKSHVLLMAGEILIGGKQNRVLRDDILLPPASGPRTVAVYCVEQGRWNEGRRDFESKSTFAQPGLRREVYDRAPQARVWSEVSRSTRAAAAPPSPTASYQEIYEQPVVRRELDEAERSLDVKAVVAAVGAAVFVGTSFTGLDFFREGDLFARQWRKLLRAHALEAHSRPGGASVPEADLRGRLRSMLADTAAAGGSIRGSAGVGRLCEWRVDRYRGAALAHEGTIVHAAIV